MFNSCDQAMYFFLKTYSRLVTIKNYMKIVPADLTGCFKESRVILLDATQLDTIITK